MSDKPFIPEVGPWAEEKLKCLNQYLGAYTTILRKQKFKGYVYIDAFAGAGTAKIRKKEAANTEETLFEELLDVESDIEQERFISGSPRIALELEHPFTNYVFIEMDNQRRRELEKLKEQHSSKKINIHDKNCNDYLLGLLEGNFDWKPWRGVVFLDPFGTHVPWQTVDALAKTGSFEVFINFPWMSINRLSNNNGILPKKFRENLNEYFGSEEWFDVMFKKEQTLFGDDTHNKVPEASKALLNWYRKRLKEAFGYASKARLIRNTKNSPLYYLIWAGPNETGQKIADYILKQGEAI